MTLKSPSQVSWEVKIRSRASTVSRAVTGWRSPGVASRRSTAYREFPRTTASTRRTTPLHCTGTSQREPSKTTCGSARTSARTSRSSRQLRSLGTQVSINICLSQPAIWVQCIRVVLYYIIYYCISKSVEYVSGIIAVFRHVACQYSGIFEAWSNSLLSFINGDHTVSQYILPSDAISWSCHSNLRDNALYGINHIKSLTWYII